MAAAADDTPFSFESGHKDLIHDVQVDFYGKTLASASSDRCIRIFEIIGQNQQALTTLTGHNGPVWKLSWAHPTYGGRILASCGYDKQVIIWRESTGNKWIKWFVDEFKSSVNTVQFSPTTNNNNPLELIAGCSDGSIKIYTLQNKKWIISKLIEDAHNGGVNSISWSTPSNIIMNNDDSKQNDQSVNIVGSYKRFVSGGCDNMIKIWTYEYNKNEYEVSVELNDHKDWIRDVSWSPIPTSSSHSVIASCSEDKTVIIWKENNKKWTASEIIKCESKVWSVSWSELGNILAVALGENTVQLYKEGNDGKWQNVSKVN
mmetsp:Transcript_49507/g.44300  ORF Transcript_49507/g.44300 Transcript_49507/m.44300 type:complete len:317 (-) Transcript_49507:122-1072(-)